MSQSKGQLSIADIKNALVPLLEKYRAESAMLFGSYARQEADEDSDIDIIIFGGNEFSPTDIFAIAEELHEATGKAVDLYEINEINPNTSFYHTIMDEGMKIA